MSFDYIRFTKSIHNLFKENFTLDEVKELLSVEENYTKDNPNNNSLVIKRVKFIGSKASDSKEFDFDKNFNLGVNLIIGNNLKGKSTILKIIKFCLTGSLKIREDVKSWIRECFLEFAISEETYSVHIKMESRQKSTLYKSTLCNVLNSDLLKDDVIEFESTSNTDFVKQMEDFFFRQFSLYNLQWTQKDSKKDSLKINTSNASWKTYYNFLNLESKDSSTLFYGGQSELSYQMLLGLKLTYPINRLKIKKERKEYNLSLLKNHKEIDFDKIKKEKTELYNEIQILKSEIVRNSTETKVFNNDELIKKRNLINSQINLLQDNIKIDENSLRELQKKIEESANKIDSNKNEINQLKKINFKILKQINGIKEYLEIGIFFNNIDIQLCPHCNHTVEDEKRLNEKKNKECMLCNHSVEESLTDEKSYSEKIEELEGDLIKIEKQTDLYLAKNLEIEEQSKKYSLKISAKKESINKMKFNERNFSNQFIELGEELVNISKIEKEENMINADFEKRIAVLEYRITVLENEELNKNTLNHTKYDEEIELLNQSILKLREIRLFENKDIIDSLERLILEEVKDLGIPNVQEVKIEENFKIKFLINNVYSGFEAVSEGEQLRLKLALYLGLIQLNIKTGYGKHPKFLIIDSPAKEEGDMKYIEGLKKVIEEINSKYGQHLQIIICTAVRDLQHVKIDGKKYIYDENEFLF